MTFLMNVLASALGMAPVVACLVVRQKGSASSGSRATRATWRSQNNEV